MIYYSNEARDSAINSIKDCIEKINSIPGNYLSYADSSMVNYFLKILKKEIEKEYSHEK